MNREEQPLEEPCTETFQADELVQGLSLTGLPSLPDSDRDLKENFRPVQRKNLLQASVDSFSEAELMADVVLTNEKGVSILPSDRNMKDNVRPVLHRELLEARVESFRQAELLVEADCGDYAVGS